MQGLDDAFFFVVDKIIDLQGFFLKQAFGIARVVFLIAFLLAIINYAINGTGLKDSLVKIGKALAFFFVVAYAYPTIVSYITSWTFDMARGSIYPSIEEYYNNKEMQIEEEVTRIRTGRGGYAPKDDSKTKTYVERIMVTRIGDEESLLKFRNLYHVQNHPQMTYTAAAPAAILESVMLLSGQFFDYAEGKKGHPPRFLGDTSGYVNQKDATLTTIKGLVCGFFIILTGVFAVLEYLVAFLEFMLVASVGVILLPLCIWEGSKFMSEKFVGAMVGFFVKLLFCTLTVYLLVYGFMSLLHYFEVYPFTGTAPEFVILIFTCLLFFFICKSAPGVAQGLLTGTPSLSATGAISAAAGAVAAGAATLKVAQKAINAPGKLAAGIANWILPPSGDSGSSGSPGSNSGSSGTGGGGSPGGASGDLTRSLGGGPSPGSGSGSAGTGGSSSGGVSSSGSGSGGGASGSSSGGSGSPPPPQPSPPSQPRSSTYDFFDPRRTG